jgi:hypothetical protein
MNPRFHCRISHWSQKPYLWPLSALSRFRASFLCSVPFYTEHGIPCV